jgi:alpha-ribazole phosphatase
LNTLFLTRHAHSTGNAGDVVNGIPPGPGLSEQGIEEARALGRRLADEPIELGVSSRLRRASETLAIALDGRDIPILTEPRFDEIGFGAFEGGSLAEYRAWAWTQPAEAECPGGGETRVDAASRIAAGLGALQERPEQVILVVSHGLPVRYVLDAADGRFPEQQLSPVPHAIAQRLERSEVERAGETVLTWATSPVFRAPIGGGR